MFGTSGEPGRPTANSSTENTYVPAGIAPGRTGKSAPNEIASTSIGHGPPGGAPAHAAYVNRPRPATPAGPPGKKIAGGGSGPYAGMPPPAVTRMSAAVIAVGPMMGLL